MTLSTSDLNREYSLRSFLEYFKSQMLRSEEERYSDTMLTVVEANFNMGWTSAEVYSEASVTNYHKMLEIFSNSRSSEVSKKIAYAFIFGFSQAILSFYQDDESDQVVDDELPSPADAPEGYFDSQEEDDILELEQLKDRINEIKEARERSKELQEVTLKILQGKIPKGMFAEFFAKEEIKEKEEEEEEEEGEKSNFYVFVRSHLNALDCFKVAKLDSMQMAELMAETFNSWASM